jgi:hypothetical protein
MQIQISVNGSHFRTGVVCSGLNWVRNQVLRLYPRCRAKFEDCLYHRAECMISKQKRRKMCRLVKCLISKGKGFD